MKVKWTPLLIIAAFFGGLTIIGEILFHLFGISDAGFLANVTTIITLLAGVFGLSGQSTVIDAKVNGNLSKALELAAANPNTDNAEVSATAQVLGLPDPTATIPTTDTESSAS